MSPLEAGVFGALVLGLVAAWMLKRQAQQRTQDLDKELSKVRAQCETAVRVAGEEAALKVQNYQRGALQAVDEKIADLDRETIRVREHYESQARAARETMSTRISQLEEELRRLRELGMSAEAEAEARSRLAEAVSEGSALRAEAQRLLESARASAVEERAIAQQRATDLTAKADAVLEQATRDAGRIVAAAEAKAVQVGGDAYVALREKDELERAVKAISNVIGGYGDRYVIPTHSVLDELAVDYSHAAAGESLRMARAQSRRMVEEGDAASCDYAEAGRRATAIRFVIDAFNGRVDAMLTRVKHDNHRTLAQEIQDAAALVNLNGQAFRSARVNPVYIDARLAEVRWAVVVQELRLREREEQRRIQEQIREEEKARRDYERALQEAGREEARLKTAMDRARAEVENASAAERAALEARLVELSDRLVQAEAKSQRALSMAQQTRAGNVYVISNVGSFGEEVFKIGMTRRLEPIDRIKELGDASVPFEFDIHAMIYSDDAPALERLLHKDLEDYRINRVNYRKEFFRVPLERVRKVVTEQRLEARFTMLAEALEYRESLALEKMSPEERRSYQVEEPENSPAD